MSTRYATSDDSKEKQAVGELWELKSEGRALFLMAEEKDVQGRDVWQYGRAL
jgi:type III restriction enzyme